MKIGVIGLGSIGRRHCENLITLGARDITLLRQHGRGNDLGLSECYDWDQFHREPWDAVVLANRTCDHAKSLMALLGRSSHLFIEKPIVANPAELGKVERLANTHQGVIFVGMNMRFHPATLCVEDLIKNEAIGKPRMARAFVGQYLPDWRPTTDYRQSYSANPALGGGVVLDLIHELDLVHHFFGDPDSPIAATVARISDLAIESEDVAEVTYLTKTGTVVSVHLDYLVRGYERYLHVYGSAGTIKCDYREPSVTLFGRNGDRTEQWMFPKFQRNDMYLSEMDHFLSCVRNGTKPITNFLQACQVTHNALSIRSQFKENRHV